MLIAAAHACTVALMLPLTVAAQTATYPSKPVRLIVPAAPGGGADFLARIVGTKLSEQTGQTFVVDNRAGASGTIAADTTAKAEPDGYTLLLGQSTSIAIAPHLYPNARYNPLKDFKPVTQVLIVPHIITATPSAPFNTMAELVDFAKRNPGKINYASAGVGSQPHVALEAWARRLGMQLVHVPYKTNPSPDVMAGVVNLYLEASTTAIPSIQGKRLKALVVSGAERIPALPDVPTMTEFNPALDPNGVIGNSWHVIFAPAGTPDDIVNRLNTEIVRIVKSPEVQARMRALGLTPTGTPASAVASEMAADHAYWGRLIAELGIKVE